ncbi:unnamed protein product [Nippostrongylus brasiliensis]|uniref:Putative rab15, 13, 10, 1, 35, 5, and (inferred by orthology to a S. mansoni protein) n=1 Tax=Nippostrongylus brasiliensis TaxID=27835 RepID=A0A0N4XV01_NIPBR|nr:unnamed protein product [Nippostrongylus brasiliensis]
MIGESSVGKSSLLLRFVDDTFDQTYPSTIGIDFKIRTVNVDGSVIKLQIWDTAGQEKFRTLASSYYRGSHGIFIVFDITNEKTFHNIPYWLNNVERFANSNVIKFLVGNKSDLESMRQISTCDAQNFATEHDMHFLETSAKSSENVEQAFLEIVREIKDAVAPTPYVVESDSIRLDEFEPAKSDSDGWWYC